MELMKAIQKSLANLEESRRNCRGKKLSIDVVFQAFENPEKGRSANDIDNMLKVLLDTFPDWLDKNHIEKGLGLIEGDSDHSVYEIHCVKHPVQDASDAAMEIEIREWLGETNLEKAEAFAKDKHKHQLRKDGKTEYWHHLAQVVKNVKSRGVKDEDILCAAWLHDTIEDTATDYDDLEGEFSSEVAQMVAAVTKDKRLQEEKRESAYLAQIKESGWKAQVIKLADIWANMADVESGYPEFEKRAEQIKKKVRYFDSIKAGLARDSSKIPHLSKAIDEINIIISKYAASGISPISLT
jgi:guanosine-3',5'-bis(diphosphate) 3'-pyrophosphohydrolase